MENILSEYDKLVMRAMALKEKRRRQLHAGPLIFDEWLPVVTPMYHWGWRHLVYVRNELHRITTGEIKKLMIFMPPRHGKTECVTIRYPAWYLEQYPDKRVIVGCYNQILANKFSRKSRRIIRDRVQLSNERTAVEDWETRVGGGYRAIGVGAGITGQGGDLVIIDDPVKSREEANSVAYRERVWEWYTDDLYTRLEPNAALILIMTRWHDDDLAGRILASDDAPNWSVISLPALAEENDPLGRNEGEALCPDRYEVDKLLEIQSIQKATARVINYQTFILKVIKLTMPTMNMTALLMTGMTVLSLQYMDQKIPMKFFSNLK